MKMKRAEFMILGIFLLSLLIGIYYYPQMPDQLATHWNIKGEVDGYQPRFWGVFSIPLLLAGLSLVFILIPRIDPLKDKFLAFRQYYDGFMLLFFLFIICIYLFIIFWNLEIITAPHAILTLVNMGSGLLFYYLGILCKHAKRNWFVGIRTPWTLSSDIVWSKTNKLGGDLLRFAGVITLSGIIFPNYTILFIFLPISLVSVYTIAYSYCEYQKEVNRE